MRMTFPLSCVVNILFHSVEADLIDHDHILGFNVIDSFKACVGWPNVNDVCGIGSLVRCSRLSSWIAHIDKL